MKRAKRRCVHSLVDWTGRIVYQWFGGFKR